MIDYRLNNDQASAGFQVLYGMYPNNVFKFEKN